MTNRPLASLITVGITVAALAGSAIALGAQSPDRSKLPGSGPVPVLKLPAIEKRQLSNGLPVWIVELHVIAGRAPRGAVRELTCVRDPDLLASHLEDAAHYPGGRATELIAPASEADIATALRERRTLLTIGAQSSLTGGATPMGETLLSTARLNALETTGHGRRFWPPFAPRCRRSNRFRGPGCACSPKPSVRRRSTRRSRSCCSDSRPRSGTSGIRRAVKTPTPARTSRSASTRTPSCGSIRPRSSCRSTPISSRAAPGAFVTHAISHHAAVQSSPNA